MTVEEVSVSHSVRMCVCVCVCVGGCMCVSVCVALIRPRDASNDLVLSKKSIIQVPGLEKSGSDVQEHEVILDKDVLSSQSGGKKTGNRERKSNNPQLTKPNVLLH